MASLYKRDGVFYASFYNQHRSPARKRFSLRTTRRRTARRILTRLEDDYYEGQFNPWRDDPWTYDEDPFEDLPLAEAKKRFLNVKREEGCSPHTIRTYEDVLRLLEKEVGANLLVRRLTSSMLRSVIRDPNLARATQRKRYGHLLTFLSWCEAEDYLGEHPMRDLQRPPAPAKLPKAITREELKTLCDVLHSGGDIR